MNWIVFWQWLQDLGVVVGAALVAAVASYPIWSSYVKELLIGWIDKRFKKQMQDADHAFEEKVRHVQSAIDRELDRARKLQDREFEALSEGWEILHEAFWRARAATNRGYEVVDVTAMEEGQLIEFVANLDFPSWRKKQLRDLIDRRATPDSIQMYYVKGWRTKQYADCQRWHTKLVQYVDRRGIFMQPEIKDRFDRLQRLISAALIELSLRNRDIGALTRRFEEYDQSDALRDAERGLYVELESLIRERIWSPVQPAATAQRIAS